MANRFDSSNGTPYQYTPLYAPLPLHDLTLLAKQHSDKHRNALDDINKEKGLLKVNADPRNVEFRNNLINSYNNKLTDLSDKIVNEGYTPENQSEWLKLKSNIVSDPNRLALEESYKDYTEKYQPNLNKAKEEGTYSDFYDPYKGEGNPNQVTPFTYKGMKTKQDYIPEMDKAIDGLKADSRAWEGYIKDKEGKPIINEFGQLTKTNGEKEVLDAKKLKQIAEIVAPTFFQSPKSQYYIDEAFGKEMPAFNYLSKEQQDALVGNATSDIIRRGSTQLFSQIKSGTDLQNLPKHALDKMDANLTTSTQSEALTNDFNNQLVTDMKFDSKGNLQVPIDPSIKNTGTSKGTSGIAGTEGLTPGQGKDLNKMADQVKFVMTLQDQHPELKGLTPKATVEAYQKANKSVASESIPLETISNVAAKNIGDAISRNKTQRNFYIWDSKDKTTDGTLETVLKKLDISEEAFDKALQSGIGGYTQAGPVSGAYYVEVKNDDGETRRVMISPDQEMQKTFRTSQAVNNARKSLTESIITPIEEIPNYKILVKPQITKNGSVNWQYIEARTDENGNIVKSNPTTLDAIRAAERNHLKKSGYLGSNLGVLKDNTTE